MNQVMFCRLFLLLAVITSGLSFSEVPKTKVQVGFFNQGEEPERYNVISTINVNGVDYKPGDHDLQPGLFFNLGWFGMSYVTLDLETADQTTILRKFLL